MKIEYRRINHVTLAVPAGEHEKVRAFYGSVLGLKEVERPDALKKVYDLIWYEWMDILLHIDFTPPWIKPAENVSAVDVSAYRAFESISNSVETVRVTICRVEKEQSYFLEPSRYTNTRHARPLDTFSNRWPRLLIATKYLVVRGQDTRDSHDDAA